MSKEAASATDRITASLRIKRQGSDSPPVIYARWRDPRDGRQVERRLGRGWLIADGEPGGKPNGRSFRGWRERRGRPSEGYLTLDMARELLPEAVEDWRSSARKSVASGQAVTCREAAEAWLSARSAVAGWKPTTERNYRAMLAGVGDAPKHRGRAPKARLMARFGGMAVSDIRDVDVRSFLRGLDTDPGLSARSVNAHRNLLSMVLAYAVERGWIAQDPVAKIPKRREADPAELVVYSPEQIQAIARAVPDKTVSAIIAVAATSGLRMGELLELRWRDIDFERRSIHVQRSYNAGLGVTTPKGRRGRSVPLADQAAEVLAVLGQRDWCIRPGDLVFPNALGEHLDPATVRTRYLAGREAVREDDADTAALTFHALRHCFGSRCSSAGINVVTIQRWLGHASIRTTQRYMHHAPAADDAEKLSRAFASGEHHGELPLQPALHPPLRPA